MQYRLKLYRGNWAITWSERGATRRISLGTPDREAAGIAFDDWLTKQSTPEKPAIVTVGRILEGYFEARPKVYPRPSLLTFFRAKLPANINKQVCEGYAESRSALSQATVWTELGILAAALNWARKEGWIDKAPHVHRSGAPRARERWITKEEANRLVEACRSPHMRLFMELAMGTCARSGAILDLTWDRVNDRFIDFRNPEKDETNKRRAVVPINDTLRPLLTEARAAAVTDYVIEYAGGRVSSIKKAFARAAPIRALPARPDAAVRAAAAPQWMRMSFQSPGSFMVSPPVACRSP